MKLFSSLINLFFPELCPSCREALVMNERTICSSCIFNLPRTNQYLEKDNPVEKIFWGRIPVVNAASYFYYNKGSKFQRLIHELKYNGRQDIGHELGYMFGVELRGTAFMQADLIIAVPLHKSRLKKRGYNQADCIAEGLSGAMEIPCCNSAISRVVQTKTQTNKSRYERWLNVEGIFRIITPDKLMNKHILLVDDVLTTGATLEACAAAILEVWGTQVSIVTLAVA